MIDYRSLLLCVCAVYLLCCWLVLTTSQQNEPSQTHFNQKLPDSENNLKQSKIIVPDHYLHHRVKRNIIKSIISRITGKEKVKSNLKPYNNQGKVKPNADALWAKPPGYNQIPSNAFVAGTSRNGKQLYIGKGPYTDQGFKYIVPGSVVLDIACVQLAFHGYGHCVKEYEILVGSHYKWIQASKADFLNKAGLKTELSEYNSTLQICRYMIKTGDDASYAVIGKAKADGSCDVGQDGDENRYFNMFEVLTAA